LGKIRASSFGAEAPLQCVGVGELAVIDWTIPFPPPALLGRLQQLCREVAPFLASYKLAHGKPSILRREPPVPFAVLPQMRMEVRVEECRRRAAECAEKALCQADPEVRRLFAELAEQWRALAEQAEFLQQYHWHAFHSQGLQELTPGILMKNINLAITSIARI
jgi:hypothetical protein